MSLTAYHLHKLEEARLRHEADDPDPVTEFVRQQQALLRSTLDQCACLMHSTTLPHYWLTLRDVDRRPANHKDFAPIDHTARLPKRRQDEPRSGDLMRRGTTQHEPILRETARLGFLREDHVFHGDNDAVFERHGSKRRHDADFLERHGDKRRHYAVTEYEMHGKKRRYAVSEDERYVEKRRHNEDKRDTEGTRHAPRRENDYSYGAMEYQEVDSVLGYAEQVVPDPPKWNHNDDRGEKIDRRKTKNYEKRPRHKMKDPDEKKRARKERSPGKEDVTANKKKKKARKDRSSSEEDVAASKKKRKGDIATRTKTDALAEAFSSKHVADRRITVSIFLG